MFLVFLNLINCIKWYDPMDADINVVQNQGFLNEMGKSYYRLPQRFKDLVTPSVWELSRYSSSLSIHFLANTDTIQIQLETEKPYSFDMQSPLGTNGIDLYAVDTFGIYHICSGSYSFSDKRGASIQFTFSGLTRQLYEYRLFLPSFDVVNKLKIGISDNGQFQGFSPRQNERPIVVYGASNNQGSSANRPGIGWVNWLSRDIDFPVLNFGFMGHGLFDKASIEALTANNAQIYLIDCLSDLIWQPVDKVVEILMSGHDQIRSKWDETPIVLIGFTGYSNQNFDMNNKNYFINMNKACRTAYDNLIKQGAKNLYYISPEELGIESDDIVDNYHLNDIGMKKVEIVMAKKLREILKFYKGNITTQIPVTENGNVNFHIRFNAIIDLIQKEKPKKVIIGDSITNNWGGRPYWYEQPGKDSWDEFMEPRGFINYGMGSDKIENALYRVYHDSFHNFSCDEVVGLLGTNNLIFEKDEDIVEGNRFLFQQIKLRQPKARIVIMGVLPRKDMEKRISIINNMMEKMVKEEGWIYINPGVKLLKDDGTVDPTYFLPDLVHPNAAGYRRIATDVVDA